MLIVVTDPGPLNVFKYRDRYCTVGTYLTNIRIFYLPNNVKVSK